MSRIPHISEPLIDQGSTKVNDNWFRFFDSLAPLVADPGGPNVEAEDVTFDPTGDLAATDVQAALEELDTEKVPTSRTLTAGDGLIGGGTLASDRTFNVGAGTGIVSDPDAVRIADTAVTPGAYGSASTAPTFTVDQQGRLTAAASVSIRERLSTDRTYFVATTGSDSNDGLTVGTPYLTIQKALDVILATLDANGHSITVQIADGTYTGAVNAQGAWVGTHDVTLLGNTGTPANVVLNATGADQDDATVRADDGANLVVSGFEVRSTTAGIGLSASNGGNIEIGAAMRFGACATGHMRADADGSIFDTDNNYSIVGAAPYHAYALNKGAIHVANRTVTISGTPAFSTAFAFAERGGHIDLFGNTYSGAATGTRFSVSGGGSIFTSNAGLTALPGNAVGVLNGGFYDNHGGTASMLVGGSLTSSTLILRSTLGAGATDAIIHQVGNAGAVEAGRVDTAGRWLFGATTAQVDASGGTSTFQLHRPGSGTAYSAAFFRWTADATGYPVAFNKSRGTTPGSFTVVQSGDVILNMLFGGADGTNLEQAAALRVEIDGTPGNNDMPGRFVFLTTPDTGSVTPTEAFRLDSSQNATFKGAARSDHATKGIGYATGAGGTVTQNTDKTTGVTLDKVCGQITMNNATLNAGVTVGFTVTNSAVATTDVPVVAIDSGATADSYRVGVDAVGAGSFRISVTNITGGNLSEAVVLNFAVIKAVAA